MLLDRQARIQGRGRSRPAVVNNLSYVHSPLIKGRRGPQGKLSPFLRGSDGCGDLGEVLDLDK